MGAFLLRQRSLPLAMRMVCFAIGLAMLPLSSGGQGVESGTLGVTASILDQCSVGDACLARGTVALAVADGRMTVTPKGSATSISLACTSGTIATLAFGPGTHFAGNARRMKSTVGESADHFPGYQFRLQSASGHAIGTAAVALEGAEGINKTVLLGAAIDSAANRLAQPAGDYAGSVMLTITFAP